jgi:GTPase SAR1 family protein
MTTVKAKIKAIVLGDQSTGKTSIINRFINNQFTDGTGPTIGIDFLSRNIIV